jgi:hypothetical protein
MQQAPPSASLEFQPLAVIPPSSQVSESQTGTPSAAPTPQTNAALGCTVWLLPILVLCALIARRRYQLYKLRRQIEILENSWLLKSTRTPF